MCAFHGTVCRTVHCRYLGAWGHVLDVSSAGLIYVLPPYFPEGASVNCYKFHSVCLVLRPRFEQGMVPVQALLVACLRTVSLEIVSGSYVYLLVYILTDLSLQFDCKVYCQMFANLHALSCNM